MIIEKIFTKETAAEMTGDVCIPDGYAKIDTQAFCRRDDVTGVIIPPSVKTIDSKAFLRCANLVSITISEGVTNIAADAFCHCWGLKRFIVEKDNPEYCDVGGVLFNKDKTALIRYPIGNKRKKYAVPDGTISIAESVTAIGARAFLGCKLENLVIPDNVTSIGFNAFCDSKLPEIITIPDSVVAIEYGAFWGSKIKNITIPASVVSIGHDAFDSEEEGFVIRGASGSAAERYALENDIVFMEVKPQLTI